MIIRHCLFSESQVIRKEDEVIRVKKSLQQNSLILYDDAESFFLFP